MSNTFFSIFDSIRDELVDLCSMFVLSLIKFSSGWFTLLMYLYAKNMISKTYNNNCITNMIKWKYLYCFYK